MSVQNPEQNLTGIRDLGLKPSLLGDEILVEQVLLELVYHGRTPVTKCTPSTLTGAMSQREVARICV
jgi:hypothetical protein